MSNDGKQSTSNERIMAADRIQAVIEAMPADKIRVVKGALAIVR